MAVVFFTDDPKKLLAQFDKKLGQPGEKDKITTWEKTIKGYTHKSKDWHGKAFLKATVGLDKLTFNILKPSEDETVKVTVYGYYHGHLTETFLNHFDQIFTIGSSSAIPTNDDVIR